MGRYGKKIQLDEDIAEALERAAEKEGESVTEIGNRILRKSLKLIPLK